MYELPSFSPASVPSLMLFTVSRFPLQPLFNNLNHKPNSKFTSFWATLDYHIHYNSTNLGKDSAFCVVFAGSVYTVLSNEDLGNFFMFHIKQPQLPNQLSNYVTAGSRPYCFFCILQNLIQRPYSRTYLISASTTIWNDMEKGLEIWSLPKLF